MTIANFESLPAAKQQLVISRLCKSQMREGKTF